LCTVRGADGAAGDARGTIAREIVSLHSECYGKGPTKARVHASGDVLAVVLEETFTRAERTLIERGEAEGIKDIRRRFQRVMGEQHCNRRASDWRKGRAFFSDTDLDEDLSVELFILADGRTDMIEFEQAQQPGPADSA
jgi:uncharacterized protein YbcI